ncbi:MAG: phosphate ABC transporter substrate-binding protein PstS [Pseudanabaenaceae cyanobacterium]
MVFSLSRRRFLHLGLGLALGGCATTQTESEPAGQPKGEALAGGQPVALNGAGASFPFPLYQRWFREFNGLHPNVEINYQSVGSVAGIRQFLNETVDFAASDVGLRADDIAKMARGVVLVPMTAGAIVLAYNLPGVTNLQLSRQALVDLFLGKINRWNDPTLVALNPEANLPDLEVFLTHRADGSGTTTIVTQHLSAISAEWRDGPGIGANIAWPAGTGVKGNEGVVAQIQITPGAIGYTEFGFARTNRLTMATLENQAGKFVAPGVESAAVALADIEFPENFLAFVPDPQSPAAYPIASYTWILAYRQYDRPEVAAVLRAALTWGLTTGQQFATELGYVPLSSDLVSRLEPVVATIGQPV